LVRGRGEFIQFEIWMMQELEQVSLQLLAELVREF
jgi:hypothetical protein